MFSNFKSGLVAWLQALCMMLILASCLVQAEPATGTISATPTPAPISAAKSSLSTEDVANLVNKGIPELKSHVIDLTQTLTPTEQDQLDAKLLAFELEKGSQIAVLIVPTTQPEDIAQYANRVARTWQLGRKKQQDGVLLLVAKNERKLRIEVDSGLQGAIPDVYAKRIVSDIISPKFKANDYYGGIDAGVNQIIDLVNGENLAAPSKTDLPNLNLNLHLVDYWIFYLIAAIFLAEFFTKILGRYFGSTATAGVMGGVTGFVSIWPVGIFIGVVAFFVALLFTGPKSYSGVKRASSNRRDGTDSAVNFILELLLSGRSGRGGGGWSDGGGWSGGGGSSGWSGGGASGDW